MGCNEKRKTIYVDLIIIFELTVYKSNFIILRDSLFYYGHQCYRNQGLKLSRTNFISDEKLSDHSNVDAKKRT